MKRLLLLGAFCLTGLAGTAPAQADINDDFMNACVAAYGDESNEFCTCKTDQAKAFGDEEMMTYFIAFYQDPSKFREEIAAGNVPETVQDAWPRYVMQSNKVCLQPAE